MVHPAQQQLLEFFDSSHLSGPAEEIATECRNLATTMAMGLSETEAGAELTTGLRKLLEAKDCFVRAGIKLPAKPPQDQLDGLSDHRSTEVHQYD